MIGEVLLQRGTTLVRRLRLAPGEAMPWHRDPFHRITVILSGDEILIEYRDSDEVHQIPVSEGQVDWDEPTDRVHRGVNIGDRIYEEVVIFFLDDPDNIPQPTEL
ncbi:hypothetical protein KFU94_48920 [Chloroflexi bacterium TSY]|nr:hypothetical protein [Chloroflexi bacterium TSY]